MIIALDIGNTNIVIGAYKGDNLLFMERVSTDHNITSLEYAIKFDFILKSHNLDPHKTEGSIISSVVPPVTEMTKQALQRLTGKEPIIVNYKMKTDINIKIDTPQTLGNDLIVDAVAALDEFKPPLAIIDMGTATTISVIDKTGDYIGGVILPGVMVSLNSLTSRTSQLPKISIEEPENMVGKNTVDCMKSGILYGSASQIDGLIERFEENLGYQLTTVATGGIAKLIIPYCKKKIILRDELLLRGLYLLYNKNN